MIKWGPRYTQLANNWLATAGVFGVSAGLLGSWMADWKVIMERLPWYGRKYEMEPPKHFMKETFYVCVRDAEQPEKSKK